MIVLELQFDSIAEFLQMGGRYAFHVWAVYALFMVFLTYNLWMPLRQRRRFLQQQAAGARREEQRSAQRRAQQAATQQATAGNAGSDEKSASEPPPRGPKQGPQ